ncbi:hypothetical protein GCK32_004983 [Trichostrongylus colubriformis]|uniref:Uncharacterized protein n=1 Tax=Trichostrongylus colubriformis TaxID=6319 RepID=A0AAN8FMW3_TRICO
MFNCNFYYSETSAVPLCNYGSLTEPSGNTDVSPEQYYYSYDPQLPMQLVNGNLTSFPNLMYESQAMLPMQEPHYYELGSIAAEPGYIADTSTYMSDSSQSRNSSLYLDTSDDIPSSLNTSNATIPYMNDEGFYPGIFAQSRRGKRHPVLLYRIPKTDLCYVYNRLDGTYGEKVKYICRECFLLKRYVLAEVTSFCYFTEDPVRAGHICHPKRFRKEMAARQAITARYRSAVSGCDLGQSIS